MWQIKGLVLLIFLVFRVLGLPADSTRTTVEAPVDEKTTTEIPVVEKTTKEIPVEEKTTPEIPVDEKTTKEIPVEETTTTELPVEEKTTTGSPGTDGDVITTTKPIDEVTPTSPLISIGVDTGEKLIKLGESAKESVKKPSDLVKESVQIIKDGAKLGSEFGEAAVTKGIVELGRQGVVTVSHLGKMGINVTTVIANNTLGLIHKIGDMMPVGGRLVKGGALIGRKGLSVAKTLGENMLDNLVWLADNGFGWLRGAASTSRSYFDNKTDSLASSVDQGIDSGAGRLGQIISSAITKLPIFRVNASLHLG